MVKQLAKLLKLVAWVTHSQSLSRMHITTCLSRGGGHWLGWFLWARILKFISDGRPQPCLWFISWTFFFFYLTGHLLFFFFKSLKYAQLVKSIKVVRINGSPVLKNWKSPLCRLHKSSCFMHHDSCHQRKNNSLILSPTQWEPASFVQV